MFICFHVFVGWVVWYSGLLWLVIFAVVSRCDLMCKLIRLLTRGCVGSQIRFSSFAVFEYGYQILLKRAPFTKSVNKFYFPFAKYRYRLDTPAVPGKNIFCIWKKNSSSAVFICLLFLSSGWWHPWHPMKLMLLFFRIHPLLICLSEWRFCLVCLNRADRFCKL